MSETNSAANFVPVLSIVTPCFNEEEILPRSIELISHKLNQLKQLGVVHPDSYCLFVDDGSTDNTWSLIESACSEHNAVHGLKLTANVGHQTALFAGLTAVADDCDCCISIDADLQDDINAIDQMIKGFHQGYSVVLGVRNNRHTDTVFKRNSAHLYYRVARLLGVDIEPHHADFRLLSKPALRNLIAFSEQNLFLRATPAFLSKSIMKVEYKRLERTAGESKYPLFKMLALAWSGISSFSVWPLRMITFFGSFTALVSIMLGFLSLLMWLLGSTVPGWTSIMIMLAFFFSLMLLCLAVIGEYIAKIYLEVLRRPRYFVEQSTLKASASVHSTTLPL